jgi:thioredoxin 1
MSKANFNHLIQSDKPVLIDFSAEWCGPCKMLKPILQEVKSRIGDKATIVKVDVDKNPALANQFEIRGVPTLMIFKNGKSEWRQSGVIQTDKLVSILQQHGAV